MSNSKDHPQSLPSIGPDRGSPLCDMIDEKKRELTQEIYDSESRQKQLRRDIKNRNQSKRGFFLMILILAAIGGYFINQTLGHVISCCAAIYLLHYSFTSSK